MFYILIKKDQAEIINNSTDAVIENTLQVVPLLAE